jgi:chromosome segregation ATPase
MMHAWKTDFEHIVKELGLAKKRIGVLEDLVSQSKISQSTYDYLYKGYRTEAESLEERREELFERLKDYADEMEEQVRAFERRIGSVEARRVAEEMDEDLYNEQSQALQLSLRGLVEELKDVKDSLAVLEASELKLTPKTTVAEAEPGEKIRQRVTA